MSRSGTMCDKGPGLLKGKRIGFRWPGLPSASEISCLSDFNLLFLDFDFLNYKIYDNICPGRYNGQISPLEITLHNQKASRTGVK